MWSDKKKPRFLLDILFFKDNYKEAQHSKLHDNYIPLFSIVAMETGTGMHKRWCNKHIHHFLFFFLVKHCKDYHQKTNTE